MKPPRQQLPVTTVIPMTLKNASDMAIFRRDTTKILLVSSGKYTRSGSLTCRSRKCANICLKLPPVPALSEYHDLVTQGCATQSSWTRGRTPIPYAIMAKWYIVYSIYYKLYIIYYKLYSTPYRIYYTIYSIQYILYNIYYVLFTIYYIIYLQF